MLGQYRSGRQAEALKVYRQARAVLDAELGFEPCQELRDLERAVLNQDPGLDLQAAACELGTAAAPQQAGPRQLPSSVADFVGRSRHLAEIKRILLARQESEDARYAVPIVAISGPGGFGKSTLALRAAHELRADFPDGHLYVDLSGPVSDVTPRSCWPASCARSASAAR
jgi:Bacterial transcriptional activator domain